MSWALGHCAGAAIDNSAVHALKGGHHALVRNSACVVRLAHRLVPALAAAAWTDVADEPEVILFRALNA